MAHTLRMTYGGSTFNLNSGSITLRMYVPESPNLSTMDTNTILRDGGRRTLTTRRNVTESCQVLVNPTSNAASDIEAAKFTIQNWLLQAEKEGETSTGSKVYVEYAPDGLSASIYRSKLLGGKVNVNDNSLDTRWTVNRAVELDIAWTREYYWEGDLQTLTLTNSGCSSTCSTVRNQNPLDYSGQSGCYNNWVQIAGSHINGEIPTPAYIEVHNRSGEISTPDYYLFYGSGERIINFPTTLEGEDATWMNGDATDTGNACCSGGEYALKEYLADTASFHQLAYWTLPSASLQKFAGRYYNIMATGPNGNAGWPTAASTIMRMSLADSDSGIYEYTHSQGVEIVARAMQTFGTIQVPPLSQETTESTLASERLYMEFKNLATSTCTLKLDCIYIMPTDGYKHIRINYASELNSYVVDDGIDNRVHYCNSSGAVIPCAQWQGAPIMLIPDEDGRLYLLAFDSPDMDAFRTHGIKVKYRPRRLTI